MTSGVQHAQELEKAEREQLESYALKSSERRDDLGGKFREHDDESPLEFRTEYHRDRDRIIWSSAFRRLQHKTQIFPHYAEDHFRRRLTHSLEVAQIAGTLCRALKLNEVAAEAIALGHDIGHAPFGHGGEKALNQQLVKLLNDHRGGTASQECDLGREYLTQVVLYGFDHCAQGVEQVSRICQDYGPHHLGLNLSFDVRDGILKHIYDTPPDCAAKNGQCFSSLENIVRLGEFSQFGVNFGSLESQCVWFADKVGYLLGDMEDALRARIFAPKTLTDSGLLKMIWEEHRKLRKDDSVLSIESRHEFLRFKRCALAVLILDCIEASLSRIGDCRPKSVKDILEHKERLIDVSNGIRQGWDEFYSTVVCERLFRHEKVRLCEFKAQTIVDGLFSAYMADSDLLPQEIRERSRLAYKDFMTEEEVRIMAVRNYIAGMTDSFATEQHKQLYMSSERAGLL